MLASAAAAFPLTSKAEANGPNQRLRVALIGVGGRGKIALHQLVDEQFVAFGDVDAKRGKTDVYADKTTRPILEKFKDVPWFTDYRIMFEQLADTIDAVVVATPDHSHFPAAMAAIAHGKHVFVEKPLCHTISEVRRLRAAAQKAGVVTQMGNQGRTAEGIRLAREWYKAGLLGEVHTVHAWSDRTRPPWFLPPELDPDAIASDVAVPATLNWDLWLGPSPQRPYRRQFVPQSWRGYVDYGSGCLGDMGCHQLDAAYFALDLGAPVRVEAATTRLYPKTFPAMSAVKWKFPATAMRGPVDVQWFDGGLHPPPPVPGFKLDDMGGSFFYGTKATMWVASHSASARLLPESRMLELRESLPDKTVPRIQGGPYKEWTDAIRGGPSCGSNFDYASGLTEIVLLGVIAQRAQTPLTWDAGRARFPNNPAADVFVGDSFEYRPGWNV